MVSKFDWKFWEDAAMLKFTKDGKVIAVLKDSVDEPEGIQYKDGNVLEDDVVLAEEVKSIEELEEGK